MDPARLPDIWAQKHLNWPQRRSIAIRANTEVGKWARGVGKTVGLTGYRTAHNAFAMPRSLGGLLSSNYKKLKKDVVGSILRSFETFGYEEGVHYVMGTRGPRSWEQPYTKIKEWSDAMHWCSGSARVLLSQDQVGMGNGLSLDDIIVEEAKLVNGPQFFQDNFPAVRGNLDKFGHRSEHHGLLIVSDAGATPESRWFESYKEKMDDSQKERIELILQAAYRQQQLILAISSTDLLQSTRIRYMQEVAQLDDELNYLRKGAIYYHEADVFDNIDAIGWDKFESARTSLTEDEFARSYLNENIDRVDGAWYNGFSDAKHCYIPKITSFTEARGHDLERLELEDSRHDAEIITTLPIDIALDYGGKFNCIAVGQQFADVYRIDNGFHALHPEILSELLERFSNYYATHSNRLIHYFFDDTAKDKHGTTRYTYYDTVLSVLSENNWTVNPIYIGTTPPPHRRYELTVHLLRQDPPPVQWNPDNCEDMITAMKLVRIKDGPKGLIRKDKGVERKDVHEQVHAPHYSDAVDTLLWGRFNHRRSYENLPAFSIQ